MSVFYRSTIERLLSLPVIPVKTEVSGVSCEGFLKSLYSKMVIPYGPKKNGAYIVINKETKNYYIGSSGDLSSRLLHHRMYLNSNRHISKKIQESFNLAGKDVFFVVVLYTKDREEAYNLEQRLLDESHDDSLRSNTAINAKLAQLGFRHSEARREAIRLSSLGRKQSSETIAKRLETFKRIGFSPRPNELNLARLREYNCTKVISDETKKKLREINLGKKHSFETRKKMSDSQRKSGRYKIGLKKAHDRNQKTVYIDDCLYSSVSEAAQAEGIHPKTIRNRINSGKSKYSSYFILKANHGTNMDNLHTRTTSGFGISVGTGLSLETLFPIRQKVYDETRIAPPRADVGKYSECWINLATIFRNLQTSVNKEIFLKADPGELADVVLTEIEVIESLFQIEGHGTCKPIFYYCTYEKFTRQAPKEIKFRKDNTPAQIFYSDQLRKTLKEIDKQTDQIRKLDSDIPASVTANGLIFTHIPADLLSYPKFRSLELLESHTGLIKKRQLWGTKYHSMSGRDMSILPFMRKLYLIFGDRVLIYPNELKLRTAIFDTAEKRGWTGYTTESKVMLDLSLDIKELYLLQFLRDL